MVKDNDSRWFAPPVIQMLYPCRSLVTYFMFNEEKDSSGAKLLDNPSLFLKIFWIPIVSLVFIPMRFLFIVVQDPRIAELAPKSYYDVRLFFAFPFIFLELLFEHFTSLKLIIILFGVGLLSLVIGGIGIRILVQRIGIKQRFLGVALATFVALLPIFIAGASLLGSLFLLSGIKDSSSRIADSANQGIILFERHVEKPVPPEIRVTMSSKNSTMVLFRYSSPLSKLSFLEEWKTVSEQELAPYSKHSFCWRSKDGDPNLIVYAKGRSKQSSNLRYSRYLCFNEKFKKGTLLLH